MTLQTHDSASIHNPYNWRRMRADYLQGLLDEFQGISIPLLANPYFRTVTKHLNLHCFFCFYIIALMNILHKPCIHLEQYVQVRRFHNTSKDKEVF